MAPSREEGTSWRSCRSTKDSVNKALATLTEPSDVDAEAVFVVENAYAGRLRRIGDGSPLLAKRPRLTTEQANAYCEALDRLGIPRDDERRAPRLRGPSIPRDIVTRHPSKSA